MLCQELATPFCEGPDSKYLRLGKPHGVCSSYTPLDRGRKATTDNRGMKRCGWVPIKLHLQKQTQTSTFAMLRESQNKDPRFCEDC